MRIISSCIAIMIFSGCDDDSSTDKSNQKGQQNVKKWVNKHVYNIVPGKFPPVGPFEPGFHPIRIHFEFIGIFRDSEQTRFIKEVTVPHVERLVSRVLQVRDHEDKLVIDRKNCDYPGIPDKLFTEGLSDVDLVAFVKISTECEALTLMATQICQYDLIVERPQVGQIIICESWLSEEWLDGTPKKQTRIMQTFLHEFIHLLGFHSGAFAGFRKPGGSLEPRFPKYYEDATVYTCEIDPVTGRPKVAWNMDFETVKKQGKQLYFHHFFPGMLEAIDARGLKASECRCPVDPKKTYKKEDIEYCIRHPNHCAIAIVTDKVVEKTKEYFGCSEAKGMEIENGMGPGSCRLWFTTTHWKTRVAFGEIMNYQSIMRYNYVSPMTLAILEDSGWYKVDYNVFAPPVPGLTWGHLKGCPFLLNKCVESRSEVLDPDAFCTLKNTNELKCSKDALTMLRCSGAEEVKETALLTELPQYKYRTHGGRYFNNPAYMDHCPVFQELDLNSYSCVDSIAKLAGTPSPHSRCYMDKAGESPSCLPTKCSSDGKFYSVRTNSGEIISCNKAEAEISGVVCQDPTIICANLNAFHLLPGTVLIPNADI